ncbi:UDP-N-acetylglucosamine 2-epimerase (non-hydrolyzing) [Candidatus Uhrbacteria bacterium]|nr:UDP-N-acetylglucosamine 2-epimerase (non-hydrolyzing) [Candidatus Uhrbacteria bacterium]
MSDLRRIKVATIFGTRPEIIKLSRIIVAFDRHTDQKLIYTGQNFEPNISTSFFSELQIRKPDYDLSIDTHSFAAQIGSLFSKIEEILIRDYYDAVFVLGDTNSALSGIVAKRLHIPLLHMEAGNRCFSERVPEEINRRIIDHISDVNLAYSENARYNLLREGIHPQSIFVTGSPMAEVLSFYRSDIDASPILETVGLTKDGYILVSIHRAETVDDKNSISELLAGLSMVAEQYRIPVLISLHPRTAAALARFDASSLSDSFRICTPFGFFEYSKLQKNAFCVLSDSGTLFEEAAFLEFPAVQLRRESERAEAFDAGWGLLTGFQGNNIIHSIVLSREQYSVFQCPEAYSRMDVSEKVVRHLCNYIHTRELR